MTPWPALEADLRRSFRGKGLPDPVVDDLVQEAAVRLVKGLPNLRDPDRLGPYVGRVVRSVWTDHLRRRPPELAPADDLPDEPPTRDLSPEVASWLPLLIDTLAPRDRDILRLVELDGVSQQEAARQLGLSPSGARTRVQRARKRLRHALEACCTVEREGHRVVHVEANRGCSC
jgi:RNA polymerase sigma-70 factor (ECF subfamily)